MPVRIGVFDPSGCGLGTAIGLAELGHAVAYEGPAAWAAPAAGEAARLAAELALLRCGAMRPVMPGACDVVVVVDVFADFLAVFDRLAAARAGQGGWIAADDAAHVRGYAERLGRALALVQGAARAVVIDASDARQGRETAFEQLPQATLLARECSLGDDGPWRPFPYLWNTTLLWLEHLRPRREWWVSMPRAAACDWAFCGTVEHARYGERRRRLLGEAARRWPDLRGTVHTAVPFQAVLAALQSARMGLDLPGAGELCFRQHECLALGVPLLRLEPFRVAAPSGLEAVVAEQPAALDQLDPESVRAIYLRCASPVAAAQALLAAAAAPAPAPALQR